MYATVKSYAKSEWYECALVRTEALRPARAEDPAYPRLVQKRLLHLDAEALRRARRGLERWAALRHLQVAPLVAHSVNGSDLEVLHADAGGTSLRGLLERGGLEPKLILRAVRDAAWALSEVLEASGLSHGALRPSKLRLRQGEVVIVGLGIDAIADAHLITHATVPPELARFRADDTVDPSEAGDVFSLLRILESAQETLSGAGWPPELADLRLAHPQTLAELGNALNAMVGGVAPLPRTGGDSGRLRSQSPAARPGDELLGQVVQGIRLVELLASGTFGHVYRGVHDVLGQERAIKVLRAKYAGLGHIERRLTREAERLHAVQHPSVVTVHNVGLLPDRRPFVVMELLHGRTLIDLLRIEGPQKPERARALVKQIAAGLSALHAQGIIHRDIKPANVMILDGPGAPRVKILDLGVARTAEDDRTRLTRAHELLGTPAYMAPEQIEAPSEAGPLADQYALGALWYTLLAGGPPFTGPLTEVLAKKRSEAPPPLPTPDWPIVERMLAIAPEARFPSLERVPGLTEEERAPSVQRSQVVAAPTGLSGRALWIAALLLGLGVVGGITWSRLSEPHTVTVVLPTPEVERPPPRAALPSTAPAALAEPAPPSPAPSAAPKEEPSEPSPSAPRRSPRPKEHSVLRAPSRGESKEDSSKEVRAWLGAHHLRAEDLPALVPGAHDLSEPGLLERLAAQPIPRTLVERRLERVLGKLRKATLAIEELDRLDERLVSLKKRLVAGGDPAALNADVDRLELDLERSLSSPDRR
ncbi:MAG: serine/threonine-protein kinase [Myxococcota bacterium]